MKSVTNLKWNHLEFVWLAALAIMIAGSATALATTPIYTQDWESGLDGWVPSDTVWEVGIPTVGPPGVHGGTQCAGTVLAGNYPNSSDSYLLSPEFNLSSSPVDGQIWLRYWQWFDTYETIDYGRVEISVDGGSWEILPETLARLNSDVWSQNLCDLSAYQGHTIQIRFRFITDGNTTDFGYYIDDVSIEEGALLFNNPEGFEGGTGDLAATRGAWDVGVPTAGPAQAHSGTNCAGTDVNGTHHNNADSRLVFPSIELSATPQDGEIWLRYWQWFDTVESIDYGRVEISADNGPWVELPETRVLYDSDIWSQNLCDLSAYQGQSVRIAFRFISDGNTAEFGWYIDDVSVEEGALVFNNPEGFESGIGDLAVSRGAWDVGVPVEGPGQAHSGSICAGTDVNGNYRNNADTRLVFPPMVLSASPQDGEIWLRYWQWFDTIESIDYGNVEISVDNGPWEILPLTLARYDSDIWSQNLCDLSAYQGQSVRIGFHFISDGNDGDFGWYIDDVSVEEGALVSNNPEDFESGVGDLAASRGAWDVGVPSAGPGQAHSGTSCAGTDVNGTHHNNADSRLVFPSIDLSATPQDGEIWLRFWQWFDTVESIDYGLVEISADNGPWVELPETRVLYESDIWSQNLCDLSAYQGQSVRIAFRFISDGNTAEFGWYIDDVSVEEGALVFNNPEGFEAGIGDIAVSRGAWDVGEPTAGPGQAHSGTNCAGTDVGGTHRNDANSRLILPPVDLSATPQDGEIWLRFWQWFDTVESIDYGLVEISADNGPWVELPETRVLYESDIWSQNLCDLSAYQGQSVRIAFRFISDGNTAEFGWYIDDVSVEEGALVGNNPEGFENGIGDIVVSRGAWDVGVPTAGPAQAHSGTNCAGTDVGGTYRNDANSRLILPPFDLSATPQDSQIWLRYWQWFDTIESIDYGNVEISVDNGPWEILPLTLARYGSDIWSQNLCDLSAYQGQSVRIAFHFITDGNDGDFGWYIDDVSVEEGALVSNNPEDFESGIGDLAASRGAWDVGVPTAGPGLAHSGTSCAGTDVNGTHVDNVDSRLVFPPVELSASPQDGEIWLRYWQWFDTVESIDYGRVEISADNGPWVELPETRVLYDSDIWSQNLCDLSAYQGQSVRIAFRFISDGNTAEFGWYIDDVSVEEGALVFNNPEGFEAGLGDIAVTRGAWDVGVPTAGPEQAHSGTSCAGTDVNGTHLNNVDSRLVFPPMVLSDSPQDGEIWLRYWQWFDTVESIDYGRVEISADNGPWVELPETRVLYDSDLWSQNLCDLSAYQGQSVRIAFRFISDGNTAEFGWYIDDVSVEEGALAGNNPEDFESGIGDLAVSRGAWDVGIPTAGPERAHTGTGCAGTDINGTYRNFANSRLIFPPMDLSASPQDGEIWMRYWQWFQTVETIDYGRVEISADNGPWLTIPGTTVSLGSDGWSQNLVNLSAFAGQSVRVAFRFITDGNTGDLGWYIDDVSFQEGALYWDANENFEFDLCFDDWHAALDWSATNGCWEIGTPTSGPMEAHSGTGCAGTDLGGNYLNNADSRLVSPTVVLDSSPAGGEIWLRYWQWFSTPESIDYGRVEISVDGGDWELLPLSNARYYSKVWSQNLCDLSAYSGQAIRIAFRFIADGNTTDSGWYIDDISIASGAATKRGQVEGFEAGLGSWSASRGIWEVGAPTVGPAAANGGAWCVGTDLDGNYPNYGSSFLVSPAIQLDPVDGGQPILVDFQHWYEMAASDIASVQLSVDGAAWVQVDQYTGNSGDVWVAGTQIDLTSYAGSSVQLGFKIATTGSGTAPGWYLDDVTFSNLDLWRPSAPSNLVVSYFEPTGPPSEPPVHRLTWEGGDDPDFAWYGVYRGFDPDFRPDFSNRLALTTEPEFVDLDGFHHQYYYKVSAIDVNWNESVIVSPSEVVDVPDGDEGSSEIPQFAFALGENYPNPFNPATTIRYSLAEADMVELRIFDTRGNLVRTLVNGVRDAGSYDVMWLGDDDSGRQVASGVYVYVLRSEKGQISRKMSLVK